MKNETESSGTEGGCAPRTLPAGPVEPLGDKETDDHETDDECRSDAPSTRDNTAVPMTNSEKRNAETGHQRKETRPPRILTKTNVGDDEAQDDNQGTEGNEKKKKESYYVYLSRLTLIDTAEETTQWANRAKHQWGGDLTSGHHNMGSGISIRVSSQTVVRGRTPPKPLQFSSTWTGVTWSMHDTGILVPLEEDSLLVVEVVVVMDKPDAPSAKNTGPNGNSSEKVLGMGIINCQAIVDEDRQWGKFCVHLLPSLCPLDSQTVHAVVELSILSSSAIETEVAESKEANEVCSRNSRMTSRSSSHGSSVSTSPFEGPNEQMEIAKNSELEKQETEGVALGGRSSLLPPHHTSFLVAAASGTATSNLGGGDVGFTTLEYNYGVVRVSSVDFFYPPFFLSGTGQYIVSNVLCAMNMTESSALAMQLIPLKEARDYLQTSPPSIMTVRPQQRAYFTATWDLRKSAYRSGPSLELELLVHGSQTPTARILLQVHHTTPHSTTSDVPYMYWVNNTCLCNRQMISPEELPLLREVLPVYRLVSSPRGWGKMVKNTGRLPTAYVAHERGGTSAFHNLTSLPPSTVDADGSPRPSYPVGFPPLYSSTYRSDADREDEAIDINASFVLSGTAREEIMEAVAAAAAEAERGGTPSVRPKEHLHPLAATGPSGNNTRRVYLRGPLLNIQQRTCRCSLTLGPIRGFPFLESLTGQPNAFRIAITLLDKVGWKVLVGETRPSYPTASGSLQWNETLWLQKWPGATHFQFCRLHLSEVRNSDGDETPIGAGLISLPSLSKIHECVPLFVAFSVYETYSQYDQMNSPSLLMKDMSLRFSGIR